VATNSSLTKQAFEDAWREIRTLYGRSFESQFGGINGESFRTWYAGLAYNGVTDPVLSEAIRDLRRRHALRSDFAPTYAALLKLCTAVANTRLGLPSCDEAFREATLSLSSFRRQHWSHAAVYLATVECGVWWLRQQTERVARTRFEAVYDSICQRARAGESLPVAPLPHEAATQQRVPNVLGKTGAEHRVRIGNLTRALRLLSIEEQQRVMKALTTDRVTDQVLIFLPGSTTDEKVQAIVLDALGIAPCELLPTDLTPTL
jgi:hypothetical protein